MLCQPREILRTHSSANPLLLLKGSLKVAKMCLTFHIYLLRKYFVENFEKKFGGYLHFGPLKGVAHKNEHPRTPCDPIFLGARAPLGIAHVKNKNRKEKVSNINILLLLAS